MVCALIDRITKAIAEDKINGLVKVIQLGDKDILWFSITHNTGAAFSSFSGKTAALSVFTVIMLAALTIYFHKLKDKTMFTSVVFGMIVGGGLGNLYDRIVFGKVTDFINLFPFKFVFNAADVFVVIGAILLVISMLFEKKDKFDPADNLNDIMYGPPEPDTEDADE